MLATHATIAEHYLPNPIASNAAGNYAPSVVKDSVVIVSDVERIGIALFEHMKENWGTHMSQKLFSGETLAAAIEQRRREEADREAVARWGKFCEAWDRIGTYVFLTQHHYDRCSNPACSCGRSKPAGNLV